MELPPPLLDKPLRRATTRQRAGDKVSQNPSWHHPRLAANLTFMSTDHRTPKPSPQALVMAQIADEDKPMPSDEQVKQIAREHHLPHTEAKALVHFARAVSKIAEE
jgi:hypothetical protein